MPRNAGVASRKRLPARLGAVVQTVQVIEGVLAISGEHVRAESVSSAFTRRHESPDHVLAEAAVLNQMLFKGHAVETPRFLIARIVVRFRRSRTASAPPPQFLTHGRRD